MSTALDLFEARSMPEEGEKLYAYDDATGARVRAPKGKLTWGRGFNLDACGSHGLFVVMFRYFAGEIEKQLQAFPWYAALPSGVQSACLDIAYNGGIHGLLNYPTMIHLLSIKDYTGAAAQCTEKDPHLDQSRYAPLRAIIAAGL
jgi:GH24 family phage-related lysozyme (muramidase)